MSVNSAEIKTAPKNSRTAGGYLYTALFFILLQVEEFFVYPLGIKKLYWIAGLVPHAQYSQNSIKFYF